MGGIIANSSFSLTIADSVVYSSFRARTIHPRISSKLGNLATSLFKQSPVVLLDDTSNGISVKPVRSRALAKNKTLMLTAEPSHFSPGFSVLASVTSMGEYADGPSRLCPV
uniref:Molybdopterin synthase sulfur carrier subunit Molybdenum cofactor synthesis protein 2 small subunit Molybdenum cofactor synthesis protein 2A Sulfur carrier protein MOCS2A n=1 Tax=Rhizophora mucronata TaxID=61149 RepID=A0A2P2J5X7_RHIMU